MANSKAEAIIRQLKLEPLPVEGGLFRQSWRSRVELDGKPAGTCIIAMFTADLDSFSALHRLPNDEIWHFYAGDPIDLVLLHPHGRSEHVTLGADILHGQRCQFVVPAGTWMGASLVPGASYGLFGCTMAPGFTAVSYEGGDRDQLIAQYPNERATITRLTRPNVPVNRMPSGY